MEKILIGVSVVSLLIAIIAIWQNRKLQARFLAAFGEGANEPLEKTLANYFDHVRKTDAKLVKLADAYHDVTAMAGLASQKISVVRFNPFGDTGGDQSFALAVLDAHNSGYVLTSIHARTGTRVYVKPIDLGKSKYELSAEEKKAMQQAMKRTSVKREEPSGEKK